MLPPRTSFALLHIFETLGVTEQDYDRLYGKDTMSRIPDVEFALTFFPLSDLRDFALGDYEEHGDLVETMQRSFPVAYSTAFKELNGDGIEEFWTKLKLANDLFNNLMGAQ